MLIAVAIGAGRVQEIPGTGIQARVKLARRIREHCDTCLELCREKFGDPPVGDEFFTTYTCLMVLGKWHHGLASLPSVHKFVVRTVFGKMPHYSYEEAAAAHKKQLEMHPHIPLPRMELGRVLIGMGDKAAAAAHLDAFLEQVRRAHTRQHTHAHTVHPEAQHTNEHTRDPMHARRTCLARTRAREGIAVRDAAALAPARLTRGSRAAARARGRAGPRRQVQRQALQAPPRGRRHAQGDRRGAQAGGESDALRGWLGEKVRVEAPHFRRGSARARTHVRVCACVCSPLPQPAAPPPDSYHTFAYENTICLPTQTQIGAYRARAAGVCKQACAYFYTVGPAPRAPPPSARARARAWEAAAERGANGARSRRQAGGARIERHPPPIRALRLCTCGRGWVGWGGGGGSVHAARARAPQRGCPVVGGLKHTHAHTNCVCARARARVRSCAVPHGPMRERYTDVNAIRHAASIRPVAPASSSRAWLYVRGARRFRPLVVVRGASDPARARRGVGRTSARASRARACVRTRACVGARTRIRARAPPAADAPSALFLKKRWAFLPSSMSLATSACGGRVHTKRQRM